MVAPMIQQALLAAIFAIALRLLWKSRALLLAPFTSPLLSLPGPSSPSLFFGNLKQLRESDEDLTRDNWAQDHGSVLMYKGFLSVRAKAACQATFNQLSRADVVLAGAAAIHHGHAGNQPRIDAFRGVLQARTSTAYSLPSTRKRWGLRAECSSRPCRADRPCASGVLITEGEFLPMLSCCLTLQLNIPIRRPA